MQLNKIFYWICRVTTWASVLLLCTLLVHILKQGLSWVNWEFIMNFPSRYPEKAGIYTALIGSVYVIALTAAVAIPFGLGTAIYLEEYAPKKSLFLRFVKLNIANLAGMPSIIYGLLGLTLFARVMDLGRSIIAGSLTLGLLVLPVIIMASQEAIRAVPIMVREAGFAMGARRYQVIFGHVLPAALPGIMTGLILALSRAVGETAPLIVVGALSYVAFLPENMFDMFTVLPVQIYNWAGRPQPEFHSLAAAGIIILLLFLFTLNSIAVLIRAKFQRYKL
ncbi:MAG: phosphate ABC transporter permease PstA [Bdellovibrionales bacterium]